MRILMLGWELPPAITGGLGIACDGLLRGMAANGGAHVQFALPRGNEALELYPASIRILGIDGCEDRKSPSRHSIGAYFGSVERATRYTSAVMRSLDRFEDFDLIHAHDWLTFEAALTVKRVTGKPLVVHIHSTELDRVAHHRVSQVIAALERRGMDAANRVVTVSEYTKDIVIRHYEQSPDKVHVVYNAGSGPQPLSESSSLTNGCISFIGRITEQKGPESFVEAALGIREIIPDARFVMAGDGNLLPMIRSLVHALGLSEAFTFLGFIDRTEVLRLLQRSRALVMPSLSEPFGLVALEAIEAGVPVVLSKHCGLSERVRHVELIDPENIPAIVKATIRILEDPIRARRSAEAAALEASQLSWPRSAKTLHHVYQTVLASPSTTAKEEATAR